MEQLTRTKNPMNLIINADDLGMNREVNEATFGLMEQGLLTSASIIANSPNVEEACANIANYPQISFGVHLNVSEFAPLGDISLLSPLLDEDGKFVSDRLWQISVDSKLTDGIYQEFCAQIERLTELGVQISHIDSHHHVHTLPRIFPILKRVQRRFQIRKVRITKNVYGIHDKAPTVLRIKKSLYNFLLKTCYQTKTTEGFTDFRLFCEYASANRMKYRTCELMIHPGNRFYDQSEVELLRSPWRDSLGFPVRLISYRDL